MARSARRQSNPSRCATVPPGGGGSGSSRPRASSAVCTRATATRPSARKYSSDARQKHDATCAGSGCDAAASVAVRAPRGVAAVAAAADAADGADTTSAMRAEPKKSSSALPRERGSSSPAAPGAPAQSCCSSRCAKNVLPAPGWPRSVMH